MQRKIVRILLLYRIKHLTIMLTVSTHSRPKAAAFNVLSGCFSNRRFNTQPPEGGCKSASTLAFAIVGFNTQPPEGGCLGENIQQRSDFLVSTHSHPKVAAANHWRAEAAKEVSTHSHPKVAASTAINGLLEQARFNTQPPEGGCNCRLAYTYHH